MTVTVRKMEPGDWARVAEIYRQGIAEGRSTFRTECPSFEAFDAGHWQKCRFVAEAVGVVAGWCTLAPVSSVDAYRGVAEVSVYVDAGFRRRGIGAALLRRLCKESEGQGFWCLYSAIFSANAASVDLHKKCGFREIGYREKIARDRFGNWQSTTVMEYRNAIE